MAFRAVLAGRDGLARGWVMALPMPRDLISRVEPVGLADLDIQAAEARRAAFGLTRIAIETDLDTGLAAQKPDLHFDAVVPSVLPNCRATGRNRDSHGLLVRPLAICRQNALDSVGLVADIGQSQGQSSAFAEFLTAPDNSRAPETVASDTFISLAMVFGAAESASARLAISMERIRF